MKGRIWRKLIILRQPKELGATTKEFTLEVKVQNV
jgi:hypothetical protein